MAVDAWTIRTLADLAGTGPARRLMLAAESLDGEVRSPSGSPIARAPGDAIAWAHEIAELAPLALAHNKLVLNSTSRRRRGHRKSFAAVWASDDVREAAPLATEAPAGVQGTLMTSLVFRALDTQVVGGLADDIAVTTTRDRVVRPVAPRVGLRGWRVSHMGVEAVRRCRSTSSRAVTRDRGPGLRPARRRAECWRCLPV